MGGLSINCPLCCNKTFTCRESLQEHLSNVLDNLYCSICNSKSTSILELINHIGQNDCQPGPSLRHTIIYEDENTEGISDQNSADTQSSQTKEYEHGKIYHTNPIYINVMFGKESSTNNRIIAFGLWPYILVIYYYNYFSTIKNI